MPCQAAFRCFTERCLRRHFAPLRQMLIFRFDAFCLLITRRCCRAIFLPLICCHAALLPPRHYATRLMLDSRYALRALHATPLRIRYASTPATLRLHALRYDACRCHEGLPCLLFAVYALPLLYATRHERRYALCHIRHFFAMLRYATRT